MARQKPQQPAQQDGDDGQVPGQVPKDRPVKVVRIRNIRGNVWANRAQNGRLFYSVTFDRLWKDDDELGEGNRVVKRGEWHQSGSFGADDLLLLAKIADLAHTWIYRQLQDRNQTL
jgi:hypothetical protein